MSRYVYGFHAVTALIRQSGNIVEIIYVEKNRKDARTRKLEDLVHGQRLRLEHADRATLDKLVGDVVHQGVVARIDESRRSAKTDLAEALADMSDNELILVLDVVQDPANLGACLRSADAAGVRHVILPKDKSCTVTAVSRKVAAGAAETLSIHTVTNLSRALELLKQHRFWVVGMAGESASSIYGSKLEGKIALVMGNEGKGLRRLTRENCDQLLAIPMAGEVESLNVSVATGIALFEIRRQNLH